MISRFALHFREHFFGAIGPLNLQVGCLRLSQAEVQSLVVCGKEARLAHHLLSLDLTAIVRSDSGANRAAVRFLAY